MNAVMSKHQPKCCTKTGHATPWSSVPCKLPWWQFLAFFLNKYTSKFVPVCGPWFSPQPPLSLPMDLIILLISNYFKDKWVHLASAQTCQRRTWEPAPEKNGLTIKLKVFFRIPSRLQIKDFPSTHHLYSRPKGVGLWGFLPYIPTLLSLSPFVAAAQLCCDSKAYWSIKAQCQSVILCITTHIIAEDYNINRWKFKLKVQ